MGFDYFVIVGSQSTGQQGSYTTPGHYTSQTTGSVRTYGNYSYGSATTQGTYTPGQTFQYTKHGATAVIKAFRGPKPTDDPYAYDAREVLKYLGFNVK